MKTSYEKLSEIIYEAEELLKKDITSSSTEFKAWKMKAERFLISYFGEESYEHSEFKKLDFSTIYWGQSISHSDYVTYCHKDIKTAIAIFKVYLDDIEEETVSVIQSHPTNYSKVFIVHGHNGELKESVARIIEKQGIEAIILSEQANRGRTVIEKFEDHADVGGAICLFTTDDIGKAKTADEDSFRARQNVVFEAGYFMGKLGRDHVVILADEDVEIPSDLAGVVYTNTTNWQVSLFQELMAMGYKVDFNKLYNQ